jgi:transcriptional regulator with XRE-family HTH domain
MGGTETETAELFGSPQSIGEAVFVLRRRSGRDAKEIAKEAGVLLSTYSRIEHDKTRNGVYDLVAIRKIVRVLAKELSLGEDVLWRAIGEAADAADRAAKLHRSIEHESAQLGRRKERRKVDPSPSD